MTRKGMKWKSHSIVVRGKHEDVNSKMLGREVKHSIHRAANYGLFYIGHRIPTLNKTESVRSRYISSSSCTHMILLIDRMILRPNIHCKLNLL